MPELRAHVAVTDTGWATHIQARPELTEINFWLPSGKTKRLSVALGEPWLFKTRKPGRLIGGGFFTGYTRLTVRRAWDTYGDANGVGSHEALLQRINDYRQAYGRPIEADPLIGCVCLQSPTFFPYAPPIGADLFAENNPTRKAYRLDAVLGSPIEAAVQMLTGLADLPADWTAGLTPIDLSWATRGQPRQYIPRLGQQAFRAMVSGAYEQRCAITGSRLLPTLQAAHIRPVEHEGQHRTDNGLLLRADVHLLFDAGYLGLHPTRQTLEVSPRLRSVYGNGDYFYDRAGQPLVVVPRQAGDRPDVDALTWHRDTVFKR